MNFFDEVGHLERLLIFKNTVTNLVELIPKADRFLVPPFFIGQIIFSNNYEMR